MRCSSWRMLVLLPALLFFAAIVLSAGQANAQPEYDIPVANGVPVDGCAMWQSNCGQPAADQFCRSQGYAGASSWSWAYDLRTWNMGSNRYCDRAADNIRCGGLRSVVCTAAAGGATSNGTAAIDLPSLLVSAAWTWIDNGNGIGTITFYANGTASASWVGVLQQWLIDANGDLIVYGDVSGARFVTRLTYNPAAGTFHGSRDATSQVHDGVTSELRRAG